MGLGSPQGLWQGSRNGWPLLSECAWAGAGANVIQPGSLTAFASLCLGQSLRLRACEL